MDILEAPAQILTILKLLGKLNLLKFTSEVPIGTYLPCYIIYQAYFISVFIKVVLPNNNKKSYFLRESVLHPTG